MLDLFAAAGVLALIVVPPAAVFSPQAAQFVAASWGFTGLAAVAWKRWLEER